MRICNGKSKRDKHDYLDVAMQLFVLLWEAAYVHSACSVSTSLRPPIRNPWVL